MLTTSSNLSEIPSIRHGFFGRRGGVSDGDFATLNVSLRNADQSEHALENRARVASQLGARSDCLVIARQVHGTDCIVVDAPFDPFSPPNADALVSTQRGVLLGVTSADCAPVLMADRAAGVVGACHAGWRGALDGVTDSLMQSMCRVGAEPNRIVAAIGPCIAQCSYEVGDEFEALFVEKEPGNADFFERANDLSPTHFDLRGYLDRRLRAAGVIAHVDHIRIDTFADADGHFSYRRRCKTGAKHFGLQVSAIMLATE